MKLTCLDSCLKQGLLGDLLLVSLYVSLNWNNSLKVLHINVSAYWYFQSLLQGPTAVLPPV